MTPERTPSIFRSLLFISIVPITQCPVGPHSKTDLQIRGSDLNIQKSDPSSKNDTDPFRNDMLERLFVMGKGKGRGKGMGGGREILKEHDNVDTI